MFNNLLFIFSFIYGSVLRRTFKRRFLIIGLVQDHHIIPREFESLTINSKIISNINDSKNIIMLPTTYGKLILNTKRPIHENGHKNYNKYVKDTVEYKKQKNLKILC